MRSGGQLSKPRIGCSTNALNARRADATRRWHAGGIRVTTARVSMRYYLWLNNDRLGIDWLGPKPADGSMSHVKVD